MTASSDLLVRVKECDLCHQVVRVVTNPQGAEGDREVAFDYPSGEDHECWDLPPDLNTEDIMILSDGCDC